MKLLVRTRLDYCPRALKTCNNSLLKYAPVPRVCVPLYDYIGQQLMNKSLIVNDFARHLHCFISIVLITSKALVDSIFFRLTIYTITLKECNIYMIVFYTAIKAHMQLFFNYNAKLS